MDSRSTNDDAELDALLVEALESPPDQRAAYLDEVGRSAPVVS